MNVTHIMDIENSYKEILDTVSHYKKELPAISESQFQQTPEPDCWSYSEVYQHIFDSSMLSIEAMESISNGKGKPGSPTLPGKAILFAGAFPPGVRFKVPEILEGRVKKITKSEAEEMMQRLISNLKTIYPAVANADKNLAVSHPRLGDLNAGEWVRFTEIHIKHHLKQVHRIHKSLKETP